MSDTWEVKYAGETRLVENVGSFDDVQKVIEELMTKCGRDHGVPQLTKLDGAPTALVSVAVDAPISVTIGKAEDTGPVVLTDDRSGREISLEGQLRSQMDYDAAVAAGFTPQQPYYTRGTKVVDLGVQNARLSRMEHDAQPTVHQYVDEFVAQVRDEKREDHTHAVSGVRMRQDGVLVVLDENGKPESELMLNERSFGALCTRLGFGGAQYLTKCWPELRAVNVNSWGEHLRGEEDKEIRENDRMNLSRPRDRQIEVARKNVVMRTRIPAGVKMLSGTSREVYGIVSERYTPFDVDRIAEAIKEASPPDARGTVMYDGFKARFDVMFHSNIRPEKYVAGEFFKAGVRIWTDDTGGGSIGGSSMVWQNLCLNLLCIDQPEVPLFGTQRTPGIRHIGDYEQLVAKFREGFASALKRLDYFLVAWGYAQKENIIERVIQAQPEDADEIRAMSLEEAIPGIFAGIIERELVPVRARTHEAVPQLMKMWEADTSAAEPTSRARVINAFTRFAHEVEQPNVWVEDEIQKAAGALLYGRRRNDGSRADPTVLPYIPFKTPKAT